MIKNQDLKKMVQTYKCYISMLYLHLFKISVVINLQLHFFKSLFIYLFFSCFVFLGLIRLLLFFNDVQVTLVKELNLSGVYQVN